MAPNLAELGSLGLIMKWSGLKMRVEETFSPAVRGRVHIYSTAYQCSCGRGWFTVDGKDSRSLNNAFRLNLRRYLSRNDKERMCQASTVSVEDRSKESW
jgi:hypothetical protein